MLGQEDYERVIQTLLVELDHVCLHVSEEELRTLPRFGCEMATYIADLRDPTKDAAQVLYTAFAYLDEYVAADWKKVAEAGYEAYVRTQQDPGPGQG